jgi:hypothetical protein
MRYEDAAERALWRQFIGRTVVREIRSVVLPDTLKLCMARCRNDATNTPDSSWSSGAVPATTRLLAYIMKVFDGS